MKVILYENQDKSVKVVFPNEEAIKKITLVEIGKRSVFHGLPFWIKDQEELPEDYSYYNAWELDGTQGPPDGYGEMQ